MVAKKEWLLRVENSSAYPWIPHLAGFDLRFSSISLLALRFIVRLPAEVA